MKNDQIFGGANTPVVTDENNLDDKREKQQPPEFWKRQVAVKRDEGGGDDGQGAKIAERGRTGDGLTKGLRPKDGEIG